jgi:hypothetical protein
MIKEFTAVANQLKAWVVFCSEADLPWLRILKPGFRHCFVLMHDGRNWLSMDPLLNHTEVQVHHHVPASFDMPKWLADRGQKVMQAPVTRSLSSPAPMGIYTCVEAVKRVLGLHARFVFTPWQLYRHLVKNSGAVLA